MVGRKGEGPRVVWAVRVLEENAPLWVALGWTEHSREYLHARQQDEVRLEFITPDESRPPVPAYAEAAG